MSVILGRNARLSTIFTAVAVAGCATSPVTLNSQFATDRGLAPSAEALPATASVCMIRLLHVTDSRLDPSTVGMVGPRVVKTPSNFDGWIRSAFATLSNDNVRIDSDPQAVPTEALTMNVELMRAGVQSINVAIATTLVFKVRYLRGDALLKEAVYRGSDTSANWANGESEIQSHFDTVMQQVLGGAREDLATVCSQKA